MGSRKLSPEDLQRIVQLAKGWGKIVVRQAFGQTGPGLDVDLAQMEEIATAAARGLAEGALQEAANQQGQLLGGEQACPGCGRLCVVRTQPRDIQAEVTTFEHNEPQCYCPTCRRDCFPSASVAED